MLKAYPRVGGLLISLMALVLGKFTIYDVLAAARAGASQVNYSLKGVLLSVVFFEMGLAMMIFGQAVHTLKNPLTGKLSLFGWLMVLAMFVPAGAAYYWFQLQLAQLGYH